MRYVESFQFASENKRGYPFNILSPKQMENIKFGHITIFYGNNGSGKSTLLNVIAEKIRLREKTAGNINPFFAEYIEKCSFQIGYKNRIPGNSLYIRSEDIMEGITNLRKSRTDISGQALSMIENKSSEYSTDLEVQKRLDDYRRQMNDSFVQRILHKTGFYELPEEFSNGETALYFLEKVLQEDNLYFLDEPENSMSPIFQTKLVSLIETLAYQLDCQFIIASHSPFILSMKDAVIYNLDQSPVTTCEWYEPENMKAYYHLFKRFEDDFT